MRIFLFLEDFLFFDQNLLKKIVSGLTQSVQICCVLKGGMCVSSFLTGIPLFCKNPVLIPVNCTFLQALLFRTFFACSTFLYFNLKMPNHIYFFPFIGLFPAILRKYPWPKLGENDQLISKIGRN